MPKRNMSIGEKYSYLTVQYWRYVEATGEEKSALLSEMQSVTGMHRKSLVRLMRREPRRKPRSRQRGRTYGADVQSILRRVSEVLGHPCAERLKVALPATADKLAQHGHVHLTSDVREKLVRISVSTVRRMRERYLQDEPRLPRRTGGANSDVQAQVPIRRIPWDIAEPGHFEVDTVHHCGPSASGEFVHTLQMVDVATGWVESAALLGRSYRVTLHAFRRCLVRLPFPVLQVHSDNGSEFMNWHVLRFWHTQCPDALLTRIRPYKKRDNRFVEHRNGALVRALIGHDRMDTVEHVLLLNRVYDLLWLYFNFFQPVMRQTAKHYQDGRAHRKHQDIRTPYARVRASGVLNPTTRKELDDLYKHTDLVRLHDELHTLLDELFDLPCSTGDKTEDIFETLVPITSIRKGLAALR